MNESHHILSFTEKLKLKNKKSFVERFRQLIEHVIRISTYLMEIRERIISIAAAYMHSLILPIARKCGLQHFIKRFIKYKRISNLPPFSFTKIDYMGKSGFISTKAPAF